MVCKCVLLQNCYQKEKFIYDMTANLVLYVLSSNVIICVLILGVMYEILLALEYTARL